MALEGRDKSSRGEVVRLEGIDTVTPEVRPASQVGVTHLAVWLVSLIGGTELLDGHRVSMSARFERQGVNVRWINSDGWVGLLPKVGPPESMISRRGAKSLNLPL